MNSCLANLTQQSDSHLENEQDETLVANAKFGDERALTELWRRHGKVARSILWRITGNWEDAEDALQETFLKSFVHLKSFDGRSTFSTWLVRIATNSALMLLRKRRRRPEVPLDPFGDGFSDGIRALADNSEEIESRLILCEQIEFLRAAIEELNPLFRRVIELRYGHEFSVEQIAKATGLSIPAAKTRLYRARNELRELGKQKVGYARSLEVA